MSEPFIAEIRMWGCNFAPRNWAFCDGQLMPIAQNTALFSVIGTAFGGDGRTTFGLPNLQGSVPVGFGQGPGLTNRHMGETGGTETVTLSAAQAPQHTHNLMAQEPGRSSLANSSDPSGNVLAAPPTGTAYADAGNEVEMAQVLPQVGSSGSHNNIQPYLAVNFCMALNGLFPNRN